MRSPDPLDGVPEAQRWDTSQDRYAHVHGMDKGDAGTYNYAAVTLEEEAYNGGWLPGARPTGPPPRDLFTVGMRGEPGWDDDPQAGTDGNYHHPDPKAPDNSSYD